MMFVLAFIVGGTAGIVLGAILSASTQAEDARARHDADAPSWRRNR